MAVLGVGSGPIGLVAALRFKTFDSQPGKSNMGSFGPIFMILNILEKVVLASWPGIYSVFGPAPPFWDGL